MTLPRRICRGLLIAVAVVSVCACAGRDRTPVYVDSEEVRTIEVPEGLTPPPVRQTFDIPGYSLPELAGSGEARPPQVLPSAIAERARSRIRFGPTGLYLQVDDDVDSVFRRLGFALNRGGMAVREVDPDVRMYLFSFEHEPVEQTRHGMARLAFWRGTETIDYSGIYRIRVESEGQQSTRVALLDAEGRLLALEHAEFVLARLRDRLG